MRLLIMFLVIMTSCSVLNKKENTFIINGYYFVVQINSLDGKKINFNTIEVYSKQIFVNQIILDNYSEKIYNTTKPTTYITNEFKKKDLGKIVLLYTNDSKINMSNNSIEFNFIKNNKLTDLSKLYKINNCTSKIDIKNVND